MISIIIPFLYTPYRYELLKAASRMWPKMSKFEVCIHELGDIPRVENEIKDGCKYYFSKFSGPIDKCWAINLAVKELSTQKILCFLDADIVLTKEWYKLALHQTYSTGFNELVYLNKKATQKFIETNIIEEYVENKRVRNRLKPRRVKAYGGILFIPRNIFFKIKGFSENFRGWGGEDTAFYHKVKCINNIVPTIMPCKVYHLYHPREKRSGGGIIAKKMAKWSYDRWNTHIKNIKSWGDPKKYV